MSDPLETFPDFLAACPDGSWEKFLARRRDANRNDRKQGRPERYAAVTFEQKAAWLATQTMIAQADRGLNLTITPPPTEADIERLFALYDQVGDARALLSPTQETTRFVPDDDRPIGLAMIGDIHCGGDILAAQFKTDMETLAATDGLYGVGMGDYTDNFLAGMKTANGLYHGIFNEPGMQELYALRRMRIAKGKWLAICHGNHDAWTGKQAGINRTADFAAALDAPFFSEGGGTIFVELAGQRYAVAVRHNSAGNSRINTTNPQRRAFDEWPEWENCDAICLAHFHYNDLHVASRKGGRCVYLRSGTYKVRDEYAQAKGYRPEYGVPLAILYPDEKRVVAFRGDDFAAGLRFLASERAR